MLKINNLTKLYGGRGVLNSATFVINFGECAGLVGPSGSGKTTLLRIIAGEERADGGSVERTAGGRIGYLRQGYAGDAHRTAAEMFPSLFSAMADDAEIEALATRMAAAPDPSEAAQLSQAYADALDRLSSTTDSDAVPQAWQALGLRQVAPQERIGTLSGGEQTKLGLLDLVAGRPDILLLDEPTNNLDIAGLAWLDGFLDAFSGPVLLVSHDRAVLDDHATVILELDPENGEIEVFPGAYTDYAEEQSRRRAELWQRYQRQQKHIREVQSAIAGLSAKAQNIENETINFYFRKRAKKVARRAVTLKARLRRELDSADHVDKPVRQPHRVRATIAESDRAGARMLAAEGVTIGVGDRALATDIDLAVGWGEHIVIVGPNGGGKTTLLRTLLGECPPLTGAVTRGPSARIGYLPQRTDIEQGVSAPTQITPLAVVRAAAPLNEGEARRFLHRFLFTSDQVFTPLHRLSYGERRRLHLAQLVVAGVNLLILDEPTNHLDLGAREAFESALEDYDGALLAVTHDRYFIERFAHRVLNLECGHLDH